jgi:hypothetical protein
MSIIKGPSESEVVKCRSGKSISKRHASGKAKTGPGSVIITLLVSKGDSANFCTKTTKIDSKWLIKSQETTRYSYATIGVNAKATQTNSWPSCCVAYERLQ